jgi:hypothetical protein
LIITIINHDTLTKQKKQLQHHRLWYCADGVFSLLVFLSDEQIQETLESQQIELSNVYKLNFVQYAAWDRCKVLPTTAPLLIHNSWRWKPIDSLRIVGYSQREKGNAYILHYYRLLLHIYVMSAPFYLSLFKYKLGLTTWVVSAEANS